MILTIGERTGNCLFAPRVYPQKHSTRHHSNKPVFEWQLETIQQTWTICWNVTKNKEKKFLVIESVIQNTHISQRGKSRIVGISEVAVIFKNINYIRTTYNYIKNLIKDVQR